MVVQKIQAKYWKYIFFARNGSVLFGKRYFNSFLMPHGKPQLARFVVCSAYCIYSRLLAVRLLKTKKTKKKCQKKPLWRRQAPGSYTNCRFTTNCAPGLCFLVGSVISFEMRLTHGRKHLALDILRGYFMDHCGSETLQPANQIKIQ